MQAVVPLSARLECELQRMAKAGLVKYQPLRSRRPEDGQEQTALLEVVEGAQLQELDSEMVQVASNFGICGTQSVNGDNAEFTETASDLAAVCKGTTGVRQVLECAMRLRPPVLVWPVIDVPPFPLRDYPERVFLNILKMNGDYPTIPKSPQPWSA